MIADAPQLLVVNSELPVKTLQEFIAYSKAHPGAINYGTAGAGSLTNIGALQLARLAGLKIVPVAYRGVVPAVTDLIAGRIQMMHTSLGGIIAHVRSGRVRVLVVTAPERWTEFLPEVPTSAEAGLPDYTMSIWFSLAAPRQTPRPIIEQLNGYVRAMASDPVTRKRITDNFVRPASMTADQVQTFVKGEESRWERVVRDLGVTIN
jgi:tripartite-type tricarboxylate transporter receptor subunit TctC